MKRITIVLALAVFATDLFSQERKLEFATPQEALPLVYEVLDVCKNDVQLYKADTLDKRRGISFVAAEPFHYSKTKLTISFDYHLEGKSIELETPGTPVHTFYGAVGSFKDVFEIWKLLFDPSADKAALVERGFGKVSVGGLKYGSAYNISPTTTVGMWRIKVVR